MQQDFDLVINETRYRVAVPAECKLCGLSFCSTDINIDNFCCVIVMICPHMSALGSVCVYWCCTMLC